MESAAPPLRSGGPDRPDLRRPPQAPRDAAGGGAPGIRPLGAAVGAEDGTGLPRPGPQQRAGPADDHQRRDRPRPSRRLRRDDAGGAQAGCAFERHRDRQRRRPRRLDRGPAPPVRASRGRDPERLLGAGADEHPQARRGAGARQPDHDADRPAPPQRARRRRAAAPDPRDDRAPEAIRGRAGGLARDRGLGLGPADDDPRPRLGGLGRRRGPGADRGRPGRPPAAALEPGHLQRAGAADARLPARPAAASRSTRSCRSPRNDERSRSA